MVRDQGTIWQLVYQREGGNLDTVNFDWRHFADVYEAESGRSFARDYAYGAGRGVIERYFKGKTVHVDGGAFEEQVWFD